MVRAKIAALLTAFGLAIANQAIAGPLGSSQSDAAYSAKQILISGGSTSGNYWIDPNGGSTSDAFQVYADQSSYGGGWMLGLRSLHGNPSSTTDMVSNTGTVGLATPQTRNMSEFAIGKSADLRHVLTDLLGNVIFDGYYTGDYHGTFAQTSDWIVQTGDANIFSYHAGMDWSTASNDVDDHSGNCASLQGGNYPWYYRHCWTIMPANTGGWSYAPYGAGQSLGSYSIFVRELSTPDPETEIPAPGALAILGLGVIGLRYIRRKHGA